MTYDAHYAVEGRSVTVTRALATSHAHPFCPPTDGQAMREAAEVIRRDVESQVLY